MAFISAPDGAKLFFQDIGRGEPIVLAASRCLPSDMWTYNVPRLVERGRRVITFDRRGHGQSEVTTDGYDLDALADDLGAVISHLGLESPTLIGHSLGGAEVIRYLARGGHARRAVLIGPAAPRVTSAPDFAFAPPRAMVETALADWARGAFPAWIADNKWPFFTPQSSPALVDWMARMMEAIPIYVLLQIARKTLDVDQRAELAKIDVPTLVLHGALDQSVPVDAGEMVARLMPHGRFKRYEDGAHGIFLTHIDRVHADIEEFLT